MKIFYFNSLIKILINFFILRDMNINYIDYKKNIIRDFRFYRMVKSGFRIFYVIFFYY